MVPLLPAVRSNHLNQTSQSPSRTPGLTSPWVSNFLCSSRARVLLQRTPGCGPWSSLKSSLMTNESFGTEASLGSTTPLGAVRWRTGFSNHGNEAQSTLGSLLHSGEHRRIGARCGSVGIATMSRGGANPFRRPGMTAILVLRAYRASHWRKLTLQTPYPLVHGLDGTSPYRVQ